MGLIEALGEFLPNNENPKFPLDENVRRMMMGRDVTVGRGIGFLDRIIESFTPLAPAEAPQLSEEQAISPSIAPDLVTAELNVPDATNEGPVDPELALARIRERVAKNSINIGTRASYMSPDVTLVPSNKD